MIPIYAGLHSKGLQIAIASEEPKSNIFHIAGNLVFGQCLETLERDMLVLQKKIGNRKKIPPQDLAALVKKQCAGTTYIAGSQQSISLYKCSQEGVQELQSFFVGPDYIKSQLSNNFSANLSIVSSLGTMQYAFANKKSKKILFGSHIKTHLLPKEYSDWKGALHEKKKQLNYQFYHVLTTLLKQRHNLAHYAPPGQGKALVYLDALIEQNIDSYLSLGYGCIENWLCRKKLYSQEKKAYSISMPFVQQTSGVSIPMDRFISKLLVEPKKSEQQKLIVTFKPPSIKATNLHEFKQELLYLLQKQFDTPGNALKHGNYLSLTCLAKETQKICSMINEKINRYFRKPFFLDFLLETRPAYRVYIPEFAPLSKNPNLGKRTYLSQQHATQTMWNLQNIGLDQAHTITRGMHATVGIIDTGADYTHSELKTRFGTLKGYNFVSENDDPLDDHYHGTHVAGIVAGMTTGVAPECSLFALKVLDEEGFGSEADVLAAIDWCIENNVDVINMSLGSDDFSQPEYDMCQAALSKGIIIAAAAGNEGRGYGYPGSYDGVLGVAAVDINNQHAEFSNISDATDISAPGVEVYSSIPNEQYDLLSGTSMASPHIAGVAALERSLQKKIPAEFESILKATAEPLGYDGEEERQDKYGAGLVRADALLQHIINNVYKQKILSGVS